MIPTPIPPTIYTNRCKLTRITLHDMDMLRDIIEDSQFRLFMPELYEVVHEVEGMHRFLRSFDNYALEGEGFLWGIWKNTYLIGFVAIIDMSYNPTIFYAIHPEFRSKGFAKEIVAEVVAYFSTISKVPLHTEVYRSNRASLAVLAFCGFNIVGNKGDKILLKGRNRLLIEKNVSNYARNNGLVP